MELWSFGLRYRRGERALLFLYPPSRLGLTSWVGGPLGRFAVDSTGSVPRCVQSGEVGGRNAECDAGIVRHRNDHSLLICFARGNSGHPGDCACSRQRLATGRCIGQFRNSRRRGESQRGHCSDKFGRIRDRHSIGYLSQLSVNVSACVVPANSPCSMLYVNTVALAQQRLEQVSGAGQISTGASFQPVVVRVTNSASPPNPVFGATVSFLTTVLRQGENSTSGETQNPALPVILKVTQSSALTDVNGLASIVPGNAGFSAPVEVDLSANAGSSAFLNDPLFILPALAGGSGSGRSSPPSQASDYGSRWAGAVVDRTCLCAWRSRVGRLGPYVHRIEPFLAPLRGLLISETIPRLAPWAAFFHRFAAGVHL